MGLHVQVEEDTLLKINIGKEDKKWNKVQNFLADHDLVVKEFFLLGPIFFTYCKQRVGSCWPNYFSSAASVSLSHLFIRHLLKNGIDR
jgi:hypothetical protein